MCFIMKIKFYHTTPYADELRTVAENTIVDIMDEQIDDWVAVTFLSHSFLSITLPAYLKGIGPSLELVRRED